MIIAPRTRKPLQQVEDPKQEVITTRKPDISSHVQKPLVFRVLPHRLFNTQNQLQNNQQQVIGISSVDFDTLVGPYAEESRSYPTAWVTANVLAPPSPPKSQSTEADDSKEQVVRIRHKENVLDPLKRNKSDVGEEQPPIFRLVPISSIKSRRTCVILGHSGGLSESQDWNLLRYARGN